MDGKSTFTVKQGNASLNQNTPVIDINVLDNLERDTGKLSESLDQVMKNLTKKLHETSAISVAYSQTYSQTVEGMGDDVDDCSRSMYLLIAHCEELDKAMEPCHEVEKNIQRIKNTLSLLEARAAVQLAFKNSELPL